MTFKKDADWLQSDKSPVALLENRCNKTTCVRFRQGASSRRDGGSFASLLCPHCFGSSSAGLGAGMRRRVSPSLWRTRGVVAVPGLRAHMRCTTARCPIAFCASRHASRSTISARGGGQASSWEGGQVEALTDCRLRSEPPRPRRASTRQRRPQSGGRCKRATRSRRSAVSPLGLLPLTLPATLGSSRAIL